MKIIDRETHLNMICEDRTHWIIFTDDPIMQKMFDAKNYEQVKKVGLGVEYKIPVNLVQFDKVRVPRKKINYEQSN
jgi:hypothetical protein